MTTCALGHDLADGVVICPTCGLGPLATPAPEPAVLHTSAEAHPPSAAAPVSPAAPTPPVLSPDGQWQWTGGEWIPAGAQPPTMPPAPAQPPSDPTAVRPRRLTRAVKIASVIVLVLVAAAVALGATGSHRNSAATTSDGTAGSSSDTQPSDGARLSNGWLAGGGFDIDKALHACGLSPRTAVQTISGTPERMRADLSPTNERLTNATGLLTALVPEEDGTFGALHLSDFPLAYRCPDFTEDHLHLVADFCDYLPRDLAPYTAYSDSRWQSVIDGSNLGFDPIQMDNGGGAAPLIYSDSMPKPHIYCGAARSGSDEAPTPTG